jgi:signal transduction histidine kinase
MYVAGILILFSISVYLFYLQHRYEDFSMRLRNKANNTANLLLNIKAIDSSLLKIIDAITVTNMNDVSVFILDKDKKVIYSNRNSSAISELLPEFRNMNWEKEGRKFVGKKLLLTFIWLDNGHKYYVLASAMDLYGLKEQRKLQIILIGVFIISIIFIVFAGYINASQSLRPIKDIVRQVDDIKANNLGNRLPVDSNDELGELALTFNKMLERLENAFDMERTFVSNVSHELRTPVTSIIGQLEVSLLKARNEGEYKTLLLSVLDDVRNMKTIINGFLDLAETGIDPAHHTFGVLRIDEVLFTVKDEILKRKPDYIILIGFENLPEDEKDVSVMGNERLIRIMLSNLIDNACKFSSHHRVMIKIGYNNFLVTIRFVDNGIGIPEDELSKVFQPLYRAKNVMNQRGHGIGLSIVKRIAEIHKANIEINSELNVGTSVSVMFPNVKFF